jgi:hypothetical protein
VEVIIAVGVLIWRNESNLQDIQYGLKFVNISVLPEVIMEELKIFVKQKINSIQMIDL